LTALESLSQSVIEGKAAEVKEKVKSLLDAGTAPLEIINSGLIAGMNVVGFRFKNGEMFVPEVLMAARSMGEGIELVRPMIAEIDMPSIGKIVLGTVKGDLHDIGKNLVGMMLESAGFQVVNLGIDISGEQFVAAVKEHKAQVVAMSALLTTTMMAMKDTIDLISEEGLRDQVKIVIGGAPISQDFADQIGADGFAPDAASAVDLCKKLLNIA